MAARPESGGSPNYYPWATENVPQVVVEDGKTVILPNKEAILPEMQSFGLRYKQPPTSQEMNYQLNGYSLWFQHFDERDAAGTVRRTTSAETEEQLGVRWGGTWLEIGTESVGGETIRILVKQT